VIPGRRPSARGTLDAFDTSKRAFFEDQTVIHPARGGATRIRGALVINYTIRRRSARA
jgi:hypothetical protein